MLSHPAINPQECIPAGFMARFISWAVIAGHLEAWKDLCVYSLVV